MVARARSQRHRSARRATYACTLFVVRVVRFDEVERVVRGGDRRLREFVRGTRAGDFRTRSLRDVQRR